ncbi:hypothetical protein VR010_02370 [Actinomycetaceae bacterium L2_0104]
MKIGTTVGVIGVAAIVGLSTMTSATGNEGATSIDEMIPVLIRTQSAQDLPPENLPLDSIADLQRSSLRSLGSDGIADYWVARAGTSEVCLILSIPGEDAMSASTCTPLTSFYERGLSLSAGASVDDPSTAVEAYLLPADIQQEDLDISGTQSDLQRNEAALEISLLSVVPGQSGLTPTVIERENGPDFSFDPLVLKGR